MTDPRRFVTPKELRGLRHRLARSIEEVKLLREQVDTLNDWRIVAHAKIQEHEARLNALENP